MKYCRCISLPPMANRHRQSPLHSPSSPVEPLPKQENLPETSRALALAEQRLSEAAAELQQRADALRRLEAERDEGHTQVFINNPACACRSWRGQICAP